MIEKILSGQTHLLNMAVSWSVKIHETIHLGTLLKTVYRLLSLFRIPTFVLQYEIQEHVDNGETCCLL